MRLAPLLERRGVDVLAVLLALLMLADLWDGWPPLSAAGVAAAVAPLAVLLRRGFPFAAPALVFAGLAGASLADRGAAAEGEFLTPVSALALALAFWFAGAQDEGEQAVAGTAVGLASVSVVAGSAGHAFVLVEQNSDFGTVMLLLLGAGLSLAAFSLHRRTMRAAALARQATRLERERDERMHAAVEAERARIARDLHDVIAHSVSVMTVQAGAARLVLAEAPEQAREPLLSVEETGRQALAEMRRLLGLLRAENDERALAPQPGMSDLKALLERMQQAGLPVELAVQGGPEALPPGIDVAAYRIVQEALTHALERGRPARARVTVRYERGALELEIADDGHAGRNGGDAPDGYVAMRERVAVFGGELEAGPQTEGCYTVHARLPLAGGRP